LLVLQKLGTTELGPMFIRYLPDPCLAATTARGISGFVTASCYRPQIPPQQNF
jgi:hypothetical protein